MLEHATHMMDVRAKKIPVYGMAEELVEIYEDNTSKKGGQGVLFNYFDGKNTRNIIIPICKSWINSLLLRWGNGLCDIVPVQVIVLANALFDLQQFLYSHMSEFIFIIHQNEPGIHTNSNTGAVQIIASFNPEGIDLFCFNQMRLFFKALRGINTPIPLQFEIQNKNDFATEIHTAFYSGQVLCKGGNGVHHPFYGWSS